MKNIKLNKIDKRENNKNFFLFSFEKIKQNIVKKHSIKNVLGFEIAQKNKPTEMNNRQLKILYFLLKSCFKNNKKIPHKYITIPKKL